WHDVSASLCEAQALTLTVRGVDLWVGPGGSLDEGDDANDLSDSSTFDDERVVWGDLGFRGHVGSMQLVSLKDVGDELDATDDVSYLALYISDAAAGLVGLEDAVVVKGVGDGGAWRGSGA